MKKLFTAIPMKKLLLATSIVAMSSTALAENTAADLDSAVSDSLTVTAKYVTPIAVGLDTSTINFGDVWKTSTVETVLVTATVTGEANESFAYSVSTTGPVELFGAATGGSEVSVDFLDTTTQSLTFNVGLIESEALTAGTVTENVTISVKYNAIADTTTS
jgi:hypothetical protein